MLGRTIDPDLFTQLRNANLLLRPIQKAIQALDDLAVRMAITPGVVSDQALADSRAALKTTMTPALDQVNTILFEHYGFKLNDRLSVTFLHSGAQARVCPMHLSVVPALGPTESFIRVFGKVVLKSGAIGVKDYDFTLQGPNLDIEVLQLC